MNEPSEGGATRKIEDGSYYREAGRELSAARDTTVIVETLEKLCSHSAKQGEGAGGLKSLRKRLDVSRAVERQDREEVLSHVRASLDAARDRVDNWRLESGSFVILRMGIQRVYKRGGARFERVHREPSTESFHEWRKQVKHLWYQLSILNGAWPKVLGAFARELNKLADYLSEDHDLALLERRALEQSQTPGGLGHIEELTRLINHRRGQLQARAIDLGMRIYAERPGAFAKRLQIYT